MGVKLRDIVHITLIVLMVVGFLAHMWHQTNKFFTGLTTVGVSYEDRSSIKFPTFAFCDSRAYNVRQPFAATATLYNATAFNVEKEVVLSGVFGLADQSTLMPANHTVRVFPTTYNGLCKSYEFHDVIKVRSYGGKTKCSSVEQKGASFSIFNRQICLCIGRQQQRREMKRGYIFVKICILKQQAWITCFTCDTLT